MNLEAINEEWKTVEGYEGYYEVSNLGRVRSLDRRIMRSNGMKQSFKGRTLKPGKVKNGYLTVALLKKGVQKTHLIHVLVAKAFLSPYGECVNHKDGNKTNNNVLNLEWCTNSGNVLHAYRTGLRKRQHRYGESNSNAKQIIQSKNGVDIKVWGSMMDAERAGFNMKAISNVCRHKCNSHKGYQWRYVE